MAASISKPTFEKNPLRRVFSFRMAVLLSSQYITMMQYLSGLYQGIIEHYAAMSTFIFVIAMIKLGLPIVALAVNRISEHYSYKRFLNLGIYTDEQARKIARDIWRPKSKPPKWLKKITAKFSKAP